MKKYILSILILCLLCFMLPATPAQGATEQTYLLEDLALSITLPENYPALTQNMTADDPALTADVYAGYNLETAQELLAETDAVLYAMDPVEAGLFLLQLTDMELEDFSTYTDEELAALAAGREIGYESAGREVSRLEVYTHNQNKFICLDYTQPDQGESAGYAAREYLTTYDGTGFLLTFYSMTRTEIPQEQQAMLQTVVDSMTFGVQPESPAEPPLEEKPVDTQTEDTSLSPSFVYTDPLTGAQLTLAEGWVEEDTKTETGSFQITTFAHQSEMAWILFGRLDLLQSLPQEEQARVDRTTINNDLYTLEELAEYWEVDPEQVTQVTYGDREYYCTEQTLQGSSPLLPGHMHLSQLVRVENGYLYLFLLQDYTDGTYQSDFQSLVASIQYVDLQPIQGPLAFSWAVFLASLLVALILSILPILLYRYAIRRKPMPAGKALPIILLYGIILLIAMFLCKIALGGLVGVLLAIFPNYKILCAGYPRAKTDLENHDDSGSPETQEQTNEDDMEATKVFPGPTGTEDTVTQETIVFQRPEPETQSGRQFCHTCGAALQPDDETCPDCGTKIQKQI